MSQPSVVFLFGVMVLGIFAAVSGLAAASIAAALSYVPYIAYAVALKRPKLRPLRQFGVFAVIWSFLTVLLTVVVLMNSDFSAQDGHMTAFGVDVLNGWLLSGLAAPLPFVLIGGELALYLLRQRIPPEAPATPSP